MKINYLADFLLLRNYYFLILIILSKLEDTFVLNKKTIWDLIHFWKILPFQHCILWVIWKIAENVATTSTLFKQLVGEADFTKRSVLAQAITDIEHDNDELSHRYLQN